MTELVRIPMTASWVELSEELVRAHQATVWRYLRFLGSAPDIADDVTQETFLALLETRLPDRGAAALAGWLRGTARNILRARRRTLRRELATLSPEHVEAAWEDYQRDDDGARYRAALQVCLDTLSPRQREVIELRFTRRASRRQIAAAAGVGPEGAKSILRRIKDALRACIERRLDGESART